MLSITPATRVLLRSAQEAANSKVRRKQQRAKSARQLNADRASHLADLTAKILRTGQPTNFAFEGACLTGIRASLCLDGWTWPDAHDAARTVVGVALKQIGAIRPTWNQGQPEYLDLTELEGEVHCRRCRRKIDEERGSHGGRRVRFCSKMCSNAARKDKERFSGEAVSRSEYLAACAERSAKLKEERVIDCENCGTIFAMDYRSQKYCTKKCFSESKTKHQEKPCDHCGSIFKPKKNPYGVAKYCSRECAAANRPKKVRQALQCLTCSTVFYPPYPSQKRRYCSPGCNPYAPTFGRRPPVCEPIRDGSAEDTP
ncbi:hypothetical protein MWN34_18945 [Ancylobacter sp. 6x-1]|uniref:Uncharacterized protein n=1 Tax=Ancylobacter crimeensis TaxID=2579147 RepID=A0ABT0DG97_9HYPH|nr:hypothetical protein [Ancylobacter crimeensis]MCK0198980.1 hypothetical protein [Ancylobacter crimeensis]